MSLSQTAARATEGPIGRLILALAVCSLTSGCGNEAGESSLVETAVLARASLPEAPPFAASAVNVASWSTDEASWSTDEVTPVGVHTDGDEPLEPRTAWWDETAAVHRLPPTQRIASAAEDVPAAAVNGANRPPIVEYVGTLPTDVAEKNGNVEPPRTGSFEPVSVLPTDSTADISPRTSVPQQSSVILITGPDGNPLEGSGDQHRYVPASESIAPPARPAEVAPPAPIIIECQLPAVSPAGDAAKPLDRFPSEVPSRLPAVKLGPSSSPSEQNGTVPGRYAPSTVAPAAETRNGAELTEAHAELPHRRPAAPASVSVEPQRRVEGLLLHATQARHHVQQGFGAANRGMLYTARQEFLQALRIIAEAKDARSGRRVHMDALSAGLTAMDEAEDIRHVSNSVARTNLSMWVATHETPVLSGQDVSAMLPLAIIDRYHEYAQQQLGAAVAGDPTGSMALYGLARIYEHLGTENGADGVARARQSAALHEAALFSHPENHLAAHELGIVLTKLGLFEKAVAMLTRSVQLHPSSTAYRNLAVASRRFGRHQQAATAERYAAQMAEQERIAGASPSRVMWLDPEAFSRTSERMAAVPADASRPAQEGSAVRKDPGSKDSSGWWKLPIWK